MTLPGSENRSQPPHFSWSIRALGFRETFTYIPRPASARIGEAKKQGWMLGGFKTLRISAWFQQKCVCVCIYIYTYAFIIIYIYIRALISACFLLNTKKNVRGFNKKVLSPREEHWMTNQEFGNKSQGHVLSAAWVLDLRNWTVLPDLWVNLLKSPIFDG